MGKCGKIERCVAADGLRAYQAAVYRIEVECAMNGMVGESERHGVVHLAEQYLVAGRVGGNGIVATQTGVFGSCTVEEYLETGVALQSYYRVGGHHTGGLHIRCPMVARNDSTAAILKATLQHCVHAVGSQFHHCQRKSPSNSRM